MFLAMTVHIIALFLVLCWGVYTMSQLHVQIKVNECLKRELDSNHEQMQHILSQLDKHGLEVEKLSRNYVYIVPSVCGKGRQ